MARGKSGYQWDRRWGYLLPRGRPRVMIEGKAGGPTLGGPNLHGKNLGSHAQKVKGQLLGAKFSCKEGGQAPGERGEVALGPLTVIRAGLTGSRASQFSRVWAL